MARVTKAIENEVRYCEDTERLIERLGSNVGVLISNIGEGKCKLDKRL